MIFNVACRSGTIDRILSELDLRFLKGPIKKTLYESDIGEDPIEIALIPISLDWISISLIPILKDIPGVIFIEPVREGVIAYEFDT